MSTDKPITTPHEPEKPRIVLMPGNVSAEQLAAMFTRLTGKRPTPEEIAAAKVKLDGHE